MTDLNELAFKEGQTVKCKAPFIKYQGVLTDQYFWTHGMRFDSSEGYDPIGEADGEGVALFLIVKIVDMPEPYANRILYRKKTIDPDGVEGKFRPLMMIGEVGFKQLSSGGRWSYEINE